MPTLNDFRKLVRNCTFSLSVFALSFAASAHGPVVDTHALAKSLKLGDVIFIRVAAKPFREVAAATDSWTNHVGVVVSVSGDDVVIGESTFPLSRSTSLDRFVDRSEHGRVAVARLNQPLTEAQGKMLVAAAGLRAGVLYDTGFDLHSSRQFCSRYVHEILLAATGVSVGEVETFATLLSRNPATDLGFWKLWFFGQIPWDRETISPASLLRSAELGVVFDGAVTSMKVLKSSAKLMAASSN